MIFIEFVLIAFLIAISTKSLETDWVKLMCFAILMGINVAQFDEQLRNKDGNAILYNLQTTVKQNEFSHLGLRYEPK